MPIDVPARSQDTSCSLFRFVGINNGIFVVIIDLIQRYENKVVLH